MKHLQKFENYAEISSYIILDGNTYDDSLVIYELSEDKKMYKLKYKYLIKSKTLKKYNHHYFYIIVDDLFYIDILYKSDSIEDCLRYLELTDITNKYNI